MFGTTLKFFFQQFFSSVDPVEDGPSPNENSVSCVVYRDCYDLRIRIGISRNIDLLEEVEPYEQ